MNNKIRRNVIYGIAVTVLVGILLWLGFYQITGAKVPKNFTEKTTSLAELDEDNTSLNMLLTHVKNIGDEIHSGGTKSNEVVKDYIESVLREQEVPYDIEPFEFDVDAYATQAKKKYDENMSEYPDVVKENDKFLSENGYTGFEDYAKTMVGLRGESKVMMNNILVKFDSSQTEDAILFVTHYDSRPDVNSVSSSSLGVGAFLEATRMLKNHTDLVNDIYFLFTDGKEIDLLGSKEFIRSHEELMGNVKAVFNFDSQGTQGTLMLYETSQKDMALVKQYQKAVSRNTGFSFLAGICKLLPHETDFKVFQEAGVPTLNFSMLEGAYAYNRSVDTAQNMNRASANEYMTTVTELVQYYTKNKVVVEKSKESVFFNIARGKLLVLPADVVSIITYLTSMVAVGLLVFFKVRKKIRFRFVARSTIFGSIAMILTGLGAAVAIAPSLRALSSIDTKAEWNDSKLLFVLAIAIAFICSGIFTNIAMRRNKHELSNWMGQLPILLTMGLVLGQELVSLSYLFTVAIWFVFIGIFVSIKFEKKTEIRKWIYLAMLVVFGLILSIMVTPIAYVAYISLSIQVSIIIAVLSCIPISLLFVFIRMVWKEFISE